MATSNPAKPPVETDPAQAKADRAFVGALRTAALFNVVIFMGTMFVISGVILGFGAWLLAQPRCANAVTATVTAVTKCAAIESSWYSCDVHLTYTAKNRVYSDVPLTVFDSNRARLGDKVRVCFNPASPEDVSLRGEDNLGLGIALVVLGVLAVLVCAWVSRWLYRHRESAAKFGVFLQTVFLWS